MDIKDIRLRKGMSKDEVNELISEWLLLEDDVYLGNAYKHNWICRCGNIIEYRMWDKIRSRKSIKCKKCSRYEVEIRYKNEVEKYHDYKYDRAFLKGDILPNGSLVDTGAFMKITHNYCGCTYIVKSSGFINENTRCSKCCGSYEKSFAYHIEQELKLDINDVWDFDKNTLNPYHISRGSGSKVWIKCQEKDYHGSYEVQCNDYLDSHRCIYCGNHKVHPKDSFAQYHIDNTDKDFLEKYWDYDKNNELGINPFEISPKSTKKVWIKCQNEEINELNGLIKKDYHGNYEVSCESFTRGGRCNKCVGKITHIYDSFGYFNISIIDNFTDKNISPFSIPLKSGLEYDFLCNECGFIFNKRVADITTKDAWCPNCSSSKGEKRITKWLMENNINYVYDQPYFKDLLSDKGNPLRPDFIIEDMKIWIEYDGEFHYRKVTGIYGKDFDYKRQRYHDELKDEYAKKNGYEMIRIPYWDFDNIEEILNTEIVNKNKLI